MFNLKTAEPKHKIADDTHTFGAPQLHKGGAFHVSNNPLRGEQALTSANITQCILQQNNAPLSTTTKCILIWVADRETVNDSNLATWVKSVIAPQEATAEVESAEAQKSDADEAEQITPQEACAHALMQGFYNTLMPLHAEIWWHYTTPEGIEKRLTLHKNQPQYKLPDVVKDRIKQL